MVVAGHPGRRLVFYATNIVAPRAGTCTSPTACLTTYSPGEAAMVQVVGGVVARAREQSAVLRKALDLT
jgi:hypothetical protein